MSEAPKKWRIRSARTVYDNRWISVREYETIAPTGADAPYGLVHYKNFALGVLPILENGDTLLVGQERFPFGRYSWELPEGGGPVDGSPLEGAQRELSEEAGLRRRIGCPFWRTRIFRIPCPTSAPMPSSPGAFPMIKASRRIVQKNYRFEEFLSHKPSEWRPLAKSATRSPL